MTGKKRGGQSSAAREPRAIVGCAPARGACVLRCGEVAVPDPCLVATTPWSGPFKRGRSPRASTKSSAAQRTPDVSGAGEGVSTGTTEGSAGRAFLSLRSSCYMVRDRPGQRNEWETDTERTYRRANEGAHQTSPSHRRSTVHLLSASLPPMQIILLFAPCSFQCQCQGRVTSGGEVEERCQSKLLWKRRATLRVPITH